MWWTVIVVANAAIYNGYAAWRRKGAVGAGVKAGLGARYPARQVNRRPACSFGARSGLCDRPGSNHGGPDRSP